MNLFTWFQKKSVPPKYRKVCPNPPSTFEQNKLAYGVMELMHLIPQFHIIRRIGSYLVDNRQFMKNYSSNPLIWAMLNDYEALRFLLYYYDYSIDGGQQAVMFAMGTNKFEALKIVLENPALNINEDDQLSIMTEAITDRSLEMVELIMTHLDYITPDRCLEICTGISDPTFELVEMLINNPDVNVDYLSIVLILAVKNNNVELFNLLIDCPGIDVMVQYEGQTAFDYAYAVPTAEYG